MKGSIVSLSDNIKLVKIDQSDLHIKTLYKFLKHRKHSKNISHIKMPTFEEHEKFINSRPYRYWFLIKKANTFLGSAYVSKNNEIAVNLTNSNKAVFKEILIFILNNIKPLSPIPSKRNENFVLNISPKNNYYINLLKIMGARKIQETFLLKIIRK